MHETNRERIRRAVDECLSGMDGRPSLEKRVLARAKGERRGPRRLSLALAAALVLSQFVWRVEINGAGPYRADIAAYLTEAGYVPGARRDALDTSALERNLTLRYPEVAWFHAYVSNVTLVVDVTRGVPMPDLPSAQPGDVVLEMKDFTVPSRTHKRNAVNGVSLQARAGEILCIAGIDGNGQTEFIHGLTGLEKSTGHVTLCGRDISHASIKERGAAMSHIPEDRHKHGLVLDFTLEQNMVLQRFQEPQFQHAGFIRNGEVRKYAQRLIEQYDVRSGQGPVTVARSMSGGNQQKAIVAREISERPEVLVAVQPTRGLDVGAIEYIHSQLVAARDEGKAVLLVSLELDEVMNVSDRILVLYEGEIVADVNARDITAQELGLYMAGSRRSEVI